MKRLRRYLFRHLHYLVPLPILFAGVLIWAFDPVSLAQFRNYVFDEYLRLQPREYQPTPVRIVAIDDESLERFGQWPWPRTLLAKLVNRLHELGAAGIAFDIFFVDPDRTTPSRLVGTMDEIGSDDPLIARFASMPDHDQVFAEAIAGANVVLGFTPRST